MLNCHRVKYICRVQLLLVSILHVIVLIFCTIHTIRFFQSWEYYCSTFRVADCIIPSFRWHHRMVRCRIGIDGVGFEYGCIMVGNFDYSIGNRCFSTY